MHQNNAFIQNLFSPISFEKFVREYLEKKSLLIRGRNRSRFDGILSMAAIDEMLSAGYLRYPQVKLVAGGEDVPPARYVTGDEKTGMIDIEALLAEHADGATIIINYLQRHWRPLSYFCRELEQLLSVSVQSNIYLTPRFSQGFDVHYDTHDVIILQIAGEKNWRLYGSPVVLPGPDQPYRAPSRTDLRVQQRCTLKPGDCLYIPRGQLHDATSSIEPSLHVTVGLLTATWGDVLVESAKMLVRENAALRKSLPIGYATMKATRDSRRQSAKIRSTAATRLPIEKAIEGMANRFISHRPQFLEQHFLDMQQPWLVDSKASLVRRAGVLLRQSRQGDQICLQLYRKKLLMPGFVAPALEFVKTVDGNFCPDDLPDDLTAASKVVFCRRLLQEGLLKMAVVRLASADAAPPF
jgi:ribosomal protein L16 Arg81 hydroxylase